MSNKDSPVSLNPVDPHRLFPYRSDPPVGSVLLLQIYLPVPSFAYVDHYHIHDSTSARSNQLEVNKQVGAISREVEGLRASEGMAVKDPRLVEMIPPTCFPCERLVRNWLEVSPIVS